MFKTTRRGKIRRARIAWNSNWIGLRNRVRAGSSADTCDPIRVDAEPALAKPFRALVRGPNFFILI